MSSGEELGLGGLAVLGSVPKSTVYDEARGRGDALEARSQACLGAGVATPR